MSKAILIILLIIFLIAGGYFLYALGRRSATTSSNPSPSVSTSASALPSTSPSTSPTATVSPTPTATPTAHCLTSPRKSNNIRIASPLDDAVITGNSFTVSGQASVFENQFNYRLKTCKGKIMAQGTITASANSTGQASFSKTITYTLTKTVTQAILQLYDLSARDGSVQDITEVPLLLLK